MHPNPELYPWLSVAGIAWGILDCFFGYRVFKVTLALVGGFLGGFAGAAAGQALNWGPGGMITITLVAGLLGSVLAYMLYLAAVFVAGFGFGVTLGILLLANFNQPVALLSGCVIGVVGGFVAVKLQKILIMLSTALLGSFRTVLALSYFISHIDWVFYFQKPQQFPALIEGNPWMLPSILALATVGVIAQFELGGSGAKKKSDK